ncbi:MAG: cytochrome c3 family protein, partial [Planctomycetota bacterium]
MEGLRENRRVLAVFAVLIAGIGLRCAIQDRSGAVVLHFPKIASIPELTLVFSHKIHVGEEEIDCADCHGEGAELALPRERDGEFTCIDCHEDEIGERDKPGDDCTMCHKRPDFKVRWPQSPRFPGLIFPHEKHEEEPCETCHPGYDALDGVLPSAPGRMKDCVDCHKKEKKALP